MYICFYVGIYNQPSIYAGSAFTDSTNHRSKIFEQKIKKFQKAT